MATNRLKTECVGVDALAANPQELTNFLRELLDVIHLQAKEIERLTTHVEQQTKGLKPASKMPTVVSELSGLHARLQ